jgi:hypothetical protein
MTVYGNIDRDTLLKLLEQSKQVHTIGKNLCESKVISLTIKLLSDPNTKSRLYVTDRFIFLKRKRFIGELVESSLREYLYGVYTYVPKREKNKLKEIFNDNADVIEVKNSKIVDMFREVRILGQLISYFIDYRIEQQNFARDLMVDIRVLNELNSSLKKMQEMINSY